MSHFPSFGEVELATILGLEKLTDRLRSGLFASSFTFHFWRLITSTNVDFSCQGRTLWDPINPRL